MRKKRLCIAILALFIMGICTGLASAKDNGKYQGKGNSNKFTVRNIDREYNDMHGEWSREAVMEATILGFVDGWDGAFRPNQPLTHLEAIAMLVKTDLGDDPEDYDIKDSTTEYFDNEKILKKIPEWGKIYLEAAYQEGIILPEELKTFNPQQPIKRYEACIYLSRINGDTEIVPQTKGDFKDWSDIPEDYRAIVQSVHNKGLVNGDQGKFFPNQILKRCEMTVILLNLEDNVLHRYDTYKVTGTLTDVSEADNGKYTITVDTGKKILKIDANEDTDVFYNGEDVDIEDIMDKEVRVIVKDDIAVLIKVISDNDNELDSYKITGILTDVSKYDEDGAYILTIDTDEEDGVEIDADADTLILSDGTEVDAKDIVDEQVRISVEDNTAVRVVVIDDND